MTDENVPLTLQQHMDLRVIKLPRLNIKLSANQPTALIIASPSLCLVQLSTS